MNRKKFLIITVLTLAVILILVLIVDQTTTQPTPDAPETDTPRISDELILEEISEESRRATERIIEETIARGQDSDIIRIYEENEEGEVIEREIQTITIAKGTSPIDLSTGQVINERGEAVDNSSLLGSQSAPQLSFAIEDIESLPESTIFINMSMNSVEPAEFVVERGQLVNLALTNVNENTFHVRFRFDDPLLSAVVLGCAQGETKTIPFNAPMQAGEYVFYNGMFDHRERGAEGVMIVR